MSVSPAPRYRLEAITSSADVMFERAYRALDAEFGSRGELERREVIAGWLDRPSRYHLLVARDETGQLAGVRDCHLVLDVGAGVLVVYLAHALVLPRYRRSGLGALLRGVPIALARKELHVAGLDPAGIDVLIAAEMEHPVQTDPATVVRLLAYGKEGFAAVAPAQLPYFQPDFGATNAPSPPVGAALGVEQVARPLPLLAVVRWLGHEAAPTLPKRLARAFVSGLYEVFATHVARDQLASLAEDTLAVLDASTRDANEDVALIGLPRRLGDDISALAESARALTRRAVPG